MPDEYPPQQEKSEAIIKALFTLSESKTKQEKIAADIAKSSTDPIISQLARALSKSNKLMAEDILREAGYILPQNQNVWDFLKSLLDTPQPEDFPIDVVEKLLAIL